MSEPIDRAIPPEAVVTGDLGKVAEAAKGRRIGVYVCHCGGNISDYVDVEQVVAAVRTEADVLVAKTAMFACSDATQQEMQEDIEKLGLDGLVVASCSPKLHTFTFRGVAKRAGLNAYEYSQVNVREQCSWAHTDDPEGATRKAIGLVRAGVGRTRLTVPLEPPVVATTPKALVVGGGVAGLRAAIGLADIGLGVFLVEREPELGGWLRRFGATFPNEKRGDELVARRVEQVRSRPAITVFTLAELVGKSGTFGNYTAAIRVGRTDGGEPERVELSVGAIVVATGFDTYHPEAGELGYGIEGVVTLDELKGLVDAGTGPLMFHGRPVRDVAYVYCVGSRQSDGNAYCSRYCCTATAHTAIEVAKRDPRVRQYHLYRDIRTYGRNELLYAEARRKGSVFVKYADDAPPTVAAAPGGRVTVTARDLLTENEELEIEADLVVLVTGMIPRSNAELVEVLKLPVGRDGFFHEIHPKLRPVEPVVDGVYIAGACQGPKTSAESVTSALAAVTQSATLLKKGWAELDPLVATVDADACTGCRECVSACPYGAIEMVAPGGRDVAVIAEAGCKGCGGCVPLCPEDAIDLRGYTSAQITAMIDGFLSEVVA